LGFRIYLRTMKTKWRKKGQMLKMSLKLSLPSLNRIMPFLLKYLKVKYYPKLEIRTHTLKEIDIFKGN